MSQSILTRRVPYATSATSDRQLHQAIESGDGECVTRLLQAGASVNCYIDGLTPVARAIISNQESISRELLNHHPDVHQGRRLYTRISTETAVREEDASVRNDTQGQHLPLLMLAVINGQTEIAEELLLQGADVNATDELCCQTSLHMAVQTGQGNMVDFLLDQDPNVNRADLQSRAPLHLAVANGDVTIAMSLLDGGAQVNLSGQRDMLPLHVACERGDAAMVKLLLNRGSLVNVRDGYMSSPLHYAAAAGELETVRALLQRHADIWEVDEMQEMSLHKAVENGHLRVAEVLLEHASSQGQGLCRSSLLGLANQEGGQGSMKKLPIQMAAARGEIELVSVLIRHGARVNGYDSVYGETALHWAARRGDVAMVRYLLEQGADASMASQADGQTPLHVACLSAAQGQGTEVGQLLIDNGADVNAIPKGRSNGETPLIIAARYGHEDWVRLLVATPGINLDVEDSYGDHPVTHAIKYGHEDIASILIVSGCFIDIDPFSELVLYAISFGSYKSAALLIQHGARAPSDPRDDLTLANLLCGRNLDNLAQSEDKMKLLELMMCDRSIVGKPCADGSNLDKVPQSGGSEKVIKVLKWNSPDTPISLFRSSVLKVRGELRKDGRSIWPQIDKLPLPNCLKEHVKFEQY